MIPLGSCANASPPSLPGFVRHWASKVLGECAGRCWVSNQHGRVGQLQKDGRGGTVTFAEQKSTMFFFLCSFFSYFLIVVLERYFWNHLKILILWRKAIRSSLSIPFYTFQKISQSNFVIKEAVDVSGGTEIRCQSSPGAVLVQSFVGNRKQQKFVGKSVPNCQTAMDTSWIFLMGTGPVSLFHLSWSITVSTFISWKGLKILCFDHKFFRRENWKLPWSHPRRVWSLESLFLRKRTAMYKCRCV